MQELYEVTLYDKNENILKHGLVSASNKKEAIIRGLAGFEKEVDKITVSIFIDEDLPF